MNKKKKAYRKLLFAGKVHAIPHRYAEMKNLRKAHDEKKVEFKADSSINHKKLEEFRKQSMYGK